MAVATVSEFLEEIGRPAPDKAFSGLRSFERVYRVKGNAVRQANIESKVFIAYGSYDAEFTNALLVEQSMQKRGSEPTAIETVLVRRFQEFTAGQLVNVGRDVVSKGEDGRKVVSKLYVCLASDAESLMGTPGDADPGDSNLCLRSVTAKKDGVGATVRRIYIEATSTPAQIGDVMASQAGGRAFVGTDANGKVISSTRFARQWTVRYVVKGDATNIDGQWLAVNSTLAFGTRTGYLTGTSIVRQGVSFSIIARTYNELPDRLVYDTQRRYFFPGKLGFANAEPLVSEPGVTRWATIEVEETYHVGEVAAQALEFEVLYWAQGAMDFTVAATDDEGTKPYTFPGCIGEVAISASNRLFDGVLCSSIVGGVSSNPSTYPSGKKRITSRPFPWKGDIWIRRNEYVTFP